MAVLLVVVAVRVIVVVIAVGAVHVTFFTVRRPAKESIRRSTASKPRSRS